MGSTLKKATQKPTQLTTKVSEQDSASRNAAYNILSMSASGQPEQNAPTAADTEETGTASADSLTKLPLYDRYKGARDEVPVFEGKPSFTSEAFVTKVTTACRTWGITSETQKVNLAVAKLEGDAAKLVVEFNQQGAPTTFQALSDIVTQRYPVPTEESAAYVIRNKLVMQGNNLAKFVQLFNQQTQRLGFGEQALQAILQESFLTGLPTELRQLIEQSRPETGYPTLSALQSMAATLQQTRNLRAQDRATDSGHSQGSGTKRNGSDRKADKAAKKQRLHGPGAKWCEHCNVNTHNTVDCNTLKRQQDAAFRKRQQRNQPSKNS